MPKLSEAEVFAAHGQPEADVLSGALHTAE
jgi:hypothetical protein